ncbi:MAG: DegT/DnrJ/EryC1/StrS family aminotransferase [Deltaproteobacteria bacterium]|nr:DegT/DnrJ/EryC1/StrS family aminotransferase [Deltaproteobacteria bacterium]
MAIPMVDLKRQLADIRQEIDEGIASVLDSTQFILGPNVTALEQETAVYLGVKHAIGVASGTDALHLALRAAGIREGDEVITSPFTFIATAEAISYLGAKPVFVDIDPDTFNIAADRIEAAITPRTRAVLPVHLFGHPAEMKMIGEICDRHKLHLIEDCAQSFGAAFGGRQTGAFGAFGCFSFFPSKNLGGYGDGGLITTDDDRLAGEVRVLRNHGSRERYVHSLIGYNSRLDELQAVILRVKLKYIDRYNQSRRENAYYYNRCLNHPDIRTPAEREGVRHVYHQYTILVPDRAPIQKALQEAGIASAVYYPIPLHRQDVYLSTHGDVSCPVTEETAKRVLSLPIFPELTQAQIEQICGIILQAL